MRLQNTLPTANGCRGGNVLAALMTAPTVHESAESVSARAARDVVFARLP
jgi:hypothetical protein